MSVLTLLILEGVIEDGVDKIGGKKQTFQEAQAERLAL
jgi:hypothetical protein